MKGVEVKGFSLDYEEKGPKVNVEISLDVLKILCMDPKDLLEESEWLEELGRTIIEKLVEKGPS